MNFVDPDGNPINVEEWAQRFEDYQSRIIAHSTLTDDRWVRTLWHGTRAACDDPDEVFGTALYTSGRFARELGTWPDQSTALQGHAWYVGALGNAYFCQECRRTSHHPDDLRYGYCGHCHDVTGQPWWQRRLPDGAHE